MRLTHIKFFLIILLKIKSSIQSTDTVKAQLTKKTRLINLIEYSQNPSNPEYLTFYHLIKLTQPSIYILETYLDMKLITLGISMNDSLPLIVTGECVTCAVSRMDSSSIVSKFDELRRIKCTEDIDTYSVCTPYKKEGLRGLLLKTKIEVGTRNYELSSTLLLSHVYRGHCLESNEINGVIGLRQPDYDGNYESGFLRQTQLENELINPTWEIRLEENSKFIFKSERVLF